MIVLGLGFVFLLVGRKKKPGSPMEWIGLGLSSVLVLFAGILLVLGFAMGDNERTLFYDQRNAVGHDAPNFAFRLVDSDEERTLDQYQGEVVLLNFWATWCAPCLAEMPDLNQLYSDYREQGLRVITISDELRDELIAFNDIVPLETESGYITDPAGLPLPFSRMLDGRPESYVIDSEGTIQKFVLGASNYAYFEEAIRPYLDEALSGSATD
jgi:thiol-disulfide isomerase/thioredoxin